jgi:hypothetical protein
MRDDSLVEDVLRARARRDERRALFRAVLGAAAIGGAFAFSSPTAAQTVTDADILNFALNLEYLEANFYYYAVYGTPIPANLTTGTTGTLGAATGGRAVAFADPLIAQCAREIAQDELAHVTFLRNTLGGAAVAQPAIDLGVSPTGAFSTIARQAGLITDPAASFDPYASDLNFLLGAFIFEDVGVTAYKGAAPLITNTTYIDAAAGILAAEAYHASIIRTTLDQLGVATTGPLTESLSNARDTLDGTASDDDQGIAHTTTAPGDTSNIAPTDPTGIVYSRSTSAVLNVVYLNSNAVTMGGFFPAGVNGNIVTSAVAPTPTPTPTATATS